MTSGLEGQALLGGTCYLVVFFFLGASEIWTDKTEGLWWEWPYKRGGLWLEWSYKRGGLWLKWPYKRGGQVIL